MKRALPWIAFPVMFVAIVFLTLMLQRPEAPLGASRTPPPSGPPEAAHGAGLRVAPETMEHPCSACGTCVHGVEVLRERRLLTLPVPRRAKRPWEAGGGLYYFDDPSYFAAEAGRSEPGAAGGSWELELRYPPRPHSPGLPHACPSVPQRVTLVYDLVVGEESIPEASLAAWAGFEILASFEWMSSIRERPGAPPQAVNFGWRLRGLPRIEQGPCACGIP